MVSCMGAIRFSCTSLAASSGLPAQLTGWDQGPSFHHSRSTTVMQRCARWSTLMVQPILFLSVLQRYRVLSGRATEDSSHHKRILLSRGHTLEDGTTGCHASVINQHVNLPVNLEHKIQHDSHAASIS